MKFLLLFFCLFLLAGAAAEAQNQDSLAIKKFYEENAILWLGGSNYFKNNQSYRVRHLKEEFKFSPAAITEFDQFRKNQTFSTIGMFTTAGLLVSSFLVRDRHTRTGLQVGALVSLTITIPIALKKQSHLSRAIWYYNRDILLR